MRKHHTLHVQDRNFHAVVTPLAGIDAGLFEATCQGFPHCNEYADSRKEALALLADSINVSLDILRERNMRIAA